MQHIISKEAKETSSTIQRNNQLKATLSNLIRAS